MVVQIFRVRNEEVRNYFFVFVAAAVVVAVAVVAFRNIRLIKSYYVTFSKTTTLCS